MSFDTPQALTRIARHQRPQESVAAYHARIVTAERARLHSLRIAKQERHARITAKRWERMKPLVEAFAKAQSLEVAEELLALDAAYVNVLKLEATSN